MMLFPFRWRELYRLVKPTDLVQPGGCVSPLWYPSTSSPSSLALDDLLLDCLNHVLGHIVTLNDFVPYLLCFLLGAFAGVRKPKLGET
jgi:hypothetical protein